MTGLSLPSFLRLAAANESDAGNSSLADSVSSTATGASFVLLTVTATVAEAVALLPSRMV